MDERYDEKNQGKQWANAGYPKGWKYSGKGI